MYIQKKISHLFGGTRSLENQIDEFLDKVSESGMVFDRAMRVYLDQGPSEEFDAFLNQAADIERRGDDLRRAIETELYLRTLIPDLRADVLALLEGMDHLVNVYEGDLFRISIQSPDIPGEFHAGFVDLIETVVSCVDSVVLAARAFFRDIDAVRDHSSKTIFLETEADKIGTKLQRAIFASELPLERKMHLRYFVERIDELANSAEDVADELQIYTIKRRV
jgi:predicted phosphate transport protein (TIGR00153 family)